MAEDVQVIVEPMNRGTLRITWDMSRDTHQQLEAYCAEKNFTPAAKCAHHYEVFVLLNQSQSGIYIDTGLGGATNTVFPANAGIQGTVQNVLPWTTAYSGVTKDFAPSGCAN